MIDVIPSWRTLKLFFGLLSEKQNFFFLYLGFIIYFGISLATAIPNSNLKDIVNFGELRIPLFVSIGVGQAALHFLAVHVFQSCGPQPIVEEWELPRAAKYFSERRKSIVSDFEDMFKCSAEIYAEKVRSEIEAKMPDIDKTIEDSLVRTSVENFFLNPIRQKHLKTYNQLLFANTISGVESTLPAARFLCFALMSGSVVFLGWHWVKLFMLIF